MTRARLSGRVGAAVDPCAAMQVQVELAHGQERDIIFTLGIVGVAATAQGEDDVALLPVGQLDLHLHRGTGIHRGAHPARESCAAKAAGCAGVPLRPRNSLRSPVKLRVGSFTSRKMMRPGNSVL